MNFLDELEDRQAVDAETTVNWQTTGRAGGHTTSSLPSACKLLSHCRMMIYFFYVWVQLYPKLWVWLFKWMKMRFQRTSKQSKYHIGWVSLSQLESTDEDPDYENWLRSWGSGCGQGPLHQVLKKSLNWKYTVESIYVHLHTELVPKLNISTFAFSFKRKKKRSREREREKGRKSTEQLSRPWTPRGWTQHF